MNATSLRFSRDGLIVVFNARPRSWPMLDLDLSVAGITNRLPEVLPKPPESAG